MKYKSPTTTHPRSLLPALLLVLILICIASSTVSAQSGGSSSPQTAETGNRADGGLKGSVRINPRTLALEFSLALMTYPGRNGHGISAELQYSSKVWRMDPGLNWWYPVSTQIRYVTDVNARFAEGSAAGWTSSVSPPVLDSGAVFYDQNGVPFNDFPGSAAEIDAMWQEAVSAGSQLMPHGNFNCVSYEHQWCPDCVLPDGSVGVHIYICNAWEIGPGIPEPGGGGGPVQVPEHLYYVPRLYVTMPGGARHEFRRTDEKLACGTPDAICVPDMNGTFLSVDGSGMRLERDAEGAELILANGSRYIFPAVQNGSGEGIRATRFLDVNGNEIVWSGDEAAPGGLKAIDTLSRAVPDPIPFNDVAQTQHPGVASVKLPWFGGAEQPFDLKWTTLKPYECETSTDPDCEGSDGGTGGALIDQSRKLYYDARFFCRGSQTDDLLAEPGDPNSVSNEVLFPLSKSGVRPCSAFRPDGPSGAPVPVRFNPVVLRSVSLPDGSEYSFGYNRFGEIARITYPSGVYEEFDHGPVSPFNGTGEPVFDQGNRGVIERRIYDADGELQQRWTHSAGDRMRAGGEEYIVRSASSTPENADSEGSFTEAVLFRSFNDDGFGFRDPRAGAVKEIRRYDELGRLVARELYDWIARGPLPGGEPNALRDARVAGSLSFMFEPGSPHALALLSRSEFDVAGASDPGYFPHLNVSRSTAWEFSSMETSIAAGIGFQEAADAIAIGTRKSSVVAREFLYEPGYKAAGLTGLVVREKVLDPEVETSVLNETVFEHDSADSSLSDPGNPPGWSDPARAERGNVTSISRLNTDTGEWVTEKFTFDKFGNPLRSCDPTGDPARCSETGFSAAYHFAYPTSINLPAADPQGVTGSAEPFRTEKTYDLSTGLVLAVKDLQTIASVDDDRTTLFYYEDPLLRTTSVEGPAGQVTRTEYGGAPGSPFIRTLTLIDPEKWKESVARFDGFGRVVRTEDVRAEGVSVAVSEYDLHGRLKRASEPFFEGQPAEAVSWRRYTRDAAGRLVRVTQELPGGTDLLVRSAVYEIAGTEGLAAMSTTGTDGSGRSSRSLTDAIGRVIRKDEPAAHTGDRVADLGTIEAPAVPTYYIYGPRGQVVEIAQGVQRRYFAYDPFGRLVRQKLPEQEANPDLAFPDPVTGNSAWSSRFEYDSTGNLTKATDPNGVVTASDFDRIGRVIRRSYSDGTPEVILRYDLVPNGKGEVVSSSNSVSSTRVLRFDRNGNALATEQVTSGVRFETGAAYTLSGELRSEEYPTGRTVTFESDSFGDLRRISGGLDGREVVYASAFRYAADGKAAAFKFGNGLWETARFDPAGRLGSVGLGESAVDSGNWHSLFEYGETEPDGTPDPGRTNGAITRISVRSDAWPGAFVQSFSYDPAGRVSAAGEIYGGEAVWGQEFSYDRYGNRTVITTVAGGAPESGPSGFDPATNRFSSSSGFVYDRNGNVIRDPDGRTFVYDGRNKLAEVRSPDGVLLGRYFYDANGKRVKTVTPLETRVFVHSGDRVIAEYSNVRSPDLNSMFVTGDQIGSVRVLTGPNGDVISRRDHMPFGEDLVSGLGHRSADTGYPETPVATGKGFAGYERDEETGLNYAEARMYDGSHGRFTAVDPMLGSIDAGDPRSLNRYTYTLNDPVNLVDPTGLSVVDDWYLSPDGKIEVHRTEDPSDRFYVFDKNKKVFVLVAQLEKNPYGLVKFPDRGYGFTNYNPGERGGYDPNTGEMVGQGDHYLLPITAAALFGFTNQAKNDYGITIALGDMSSSNGSDPWDVNFRSPTRNGHHSSHGHKGNGVGQHIDFRYVDKHGNSQRGNWVDHPGRFDRRKNQALFDLARKWGFSKSLKGLSVPVRHVRAARGHNDHGHLGFDLRRKRPKTIYEDRRKYYLRRSDMTLDCLVERCVGN